MQRNMLDTHSLPDTIETTFGELRKKKKFNGRKGQIVFKCNNGAVASPIMNGLSSSS